MTPKIKRLLRSKFGRYAVVGVNVYIFELIVIVLLQKLGATAVEAVSVSFFAGLIVSFILQKFVAFGDKRVHRRVLVPQMIAIALLVLFNLGFTVLVTRLLANTFPTIMSRTLAIAATTIWNFYLYQTRIFKTDENPVY